MKEIFFGFFFWIFFGYFFIFATQKQIEIFFLEIFVQKKKIKKYRFFMYENSKNEKKIQKKIRINFQNFYKPNNNWPG